MSSQTFEFPTTVVAFDAKSRVVTCEGGWKVKLPDSSAAPTAGEKAQVTVSASDVKHLGAKKPPTAKRFVLGEKKVGATPSPEANTRDNR
jgi:hypothetical protein